MENGDTSPETKIITSDGYLYSSPLKINISTTHPGPAISCIVPPYRSIQTPDTGTCIINEDASEKITLESRTSLRDLVYKKGWLETKIVNLGDNRLEECVIVVHPAPTPGSTLSF
ncbi:hypothetical protein DUI87_32504 [Hirundo rustica rustica]|uniref:Uncharacterized protein n=1 Tax=Hirundo rustica rustica TaxID=333673 RepID=A0A3M0IQM6_HIRRU|nr:hypothetical protein DUI87_32504 [Hirundo rustica rustica]